MSNGPITAPTPQAAPADAAPVTAIPDTATPVRNSSPLAPDLNAPIANAPVRTDVQINLRREHPGEDLFAPNNLPVNRGASENKNFDVRNFEHSQNAQLREHSTAYKLLDSATEIVAKFAKWAKADFKEEKSAEERSFMDSVKHYLHRGVHAVAHTFSDLIEHTRDLLVATRDYLREKIKEIAAKEADKPAPSTPVRDLDPSNPAKGPTWTPPEALAYQPGKTLYVDGFVPVSLNLMIAKALTEWAESITNYMRGKEDKEVEQKRDDREKEQRQEQARHIMSLHPEFANDPRARAMLDQHIKTPDGPFEIVDKSDEALMYEIRKALARDKDEKSFAA